MNKLKYFLKRVKDEIFYTDLKYVVGGIFLGCLAAIVAITVWSFYSGKTTETIAELPEPTPSPTAQVTPSPTPSPTPEPTEDLSGKAKSGLTGLYIDKEITERRPVAAVINNMKKALPQSGLSQASVIYEVLAEGDITRLIAIFEEVDSKKIGPIRSARDYFLDFAQDYDAVFVHHGGSPSGYNAISSRKINNLDGMELEGRYFFRDMERYKTPSMMEHSSYTDSESIIGAIEKKAYKSERDEPFEPTFAFYEKPESPLGALTADNIVVPFSNAYAAEFVYDKDDRLYYKYERGNKQIDEETGGQLAVTNVIVQLTGISVIAGDEAGRRTVKLVGEGAGYLITNGSYVPIKWRKESHGSPTEWLNEKGEKLLINKGKTWICVFSGTVKFTDSAAEQEEQSE